MKITITNDHGDGLEKIIACAKGVAELIPILTGKPFDATKLEFSVSDGDVRNDEDVQRALELSKQADRLYDWRDKLYACAPARLASNLSGKATLALMGRHFEMKYNGGGKIEVNPRLFEEGLLSICWLLSHELTHVQDDQLYQIRILSLFEKMAQTEERLIKRKHELGLVNGYIRPAEEIKSLQKEIDNHKDNVFCLSTLVESHAEYVRDKFVKKAKLNMSDLISLRMVGNSLKAMPLMLIPAFRRKAKTYRDGKKLVEMAYERGVEMGILYQNIPTKEEYKSPEAYFERIGFAKSTN